MRNQAERKRLLGNHPKKKFLKLKGLELAVAATNDLGGSDEPIWGPLSLGGATGATISISPSLSKFYHQEHHDLSTYLFL